MISMFAFIIALGIVVDDAIVVGENIYEYRNRGMSFLEAAVQGARDVVMPVTFSILTNIVAFIPLCFVPGIMGKIWKVIPLVVITVFSISLVESVFILPAHLAFQHRRSKNRIAVFLHKCQQAFSRLFMRSVETVFAPFLDFCISYRQITVAMGIATLIIVISYVTSGRVGMIMMPRVEADYASVRASLPFGSPQHRVQEVAENLVRNAQSIVEENGGDALSKGIYAEIDEDEIDVRVFLTDPDIRPINTTSDAIVA